MYTLIVIGLCVISGLLITLDFKRYKTKPFLFWLIVSCLVGWVEFVTFLRFDAWVFDPKHVTGLRIAGVTVEDILFCPCFSIIFYKLFHLTERKFKQRVFNPTDKLWFTIAVCGIALVYYDIGSQFSKYMALRASIGFVGLLYCWNNTSFRHCLFFLTIVYIIGFGWDLPSVANKIWVYPVESPVYDGMSLTILGARFPIELFGYYFTGGFFSFWSIAFFERYFAASKAL